MSNSTKTTKAGGGSFPKRLGSALARTISRSSATSSSSSSSSSGTASGSSSSRTSSDEEERVNPAKPAGDAPNPHPIPPVLHSSEISRRSSNDSMSVARTWNTLSTSLGLLSLSPKQGDFEQSVEDALKEREKQAKSEERRRAKQQKAIEKQISEFHSTIQGAVFVGTLRHTSHAMERDTGGIKLFVDSIRPKDAPAKQLKKSIHFANFQQYYNNPEQHAPLQCFFDVFMKTVPSVGTRVTFMVKPTGENGNYVAIACNIAKEKEIEP